MNNQIISDFLSRDDSSLKEASDKTDLLIADIEKESKKAKIKND